MAIHSSILAWEILWTEEPGRLRPIGSQTVRDKWRDLACSMRWQITSNVHPLNEYHTQNFARFVFPSHKLIFSKYKHWRFNWASLVPQVVKNPPAVWKTWGQSLGWEDPLEEGMATHSNILPGKFPWTEESGGLQPMGSQIVGNDWAPEHSALI